MALNERLRVYLRLERPGRHANRPTVNSSSAIRKSPNPWLSRFIYQRSAGIIRTKLL